MNTQRVAAIAGVATVLGVAGALGWDAMRDESGCDSDGPGALVAVEAATGRLLWQQRVGEYHQVQVDGAVVEVDATDRVSFIDAATGETLGCGDRDRDPEDIPATSTTWVVDGEELLQPPLRSVGATEAWEVQRAPVRHADDSIGRTHQEQRVVVTDRSAGTVVWDEVLPGFEAHLLGDLVVSMDQTGGTGVLSDYGADTVVAALEVATGVERWRTELSGTPSLAVDAGGYVVVPNGTELIALGRDTGDEVWAVDHGSPGAGRVYSEPGEISDLFAVAGPDGAQILVVAVHADRPYSD